MKVLMVVVGRVRGEHAAAVAEYEKRAGRYWKLEVIEVAAGAGRRDAAPGTVKAAEAEYSKPIQARIPIAPVAATV